MYGGIYRGGIGDKYRNLMVRDMFQTKFGLIKKKLFFAHGNMLFVVVKSGMNKFSNIQKIKTLELSIKLSKFRDNYMV